MPYDLAHVGVVGQPIKSRHIVDLYASLTGQMTDQPVVLGSNLTVSGSLTVAGVPMLLVTQAQWDALVARVAALETAAVDHALRAYVQTIMAVLDPGAVPPP